MWSETWFIDRIKQIFKKYLTEQLKYFTLVSPPFLFHPEWWSWLYHSIWPGESSLPATRDKPPWPACTASWSHCSLDWKLPRCIWQIAKVTEEKQSPRETIKTVIVLLIYFNMNEINVQILYQFILHSRLTSNASIHKLFWAHHMRLIK